MFKECYLATFIGFTGTPVSSKDRNTRAVSGDYIDIYDMTQAVEDGATRPVYYENRVVKLHLDEETMPYFVRLVVDYFYDRMRKTKNLQYGDRTQNHGQYKNPYTKI